MGVLSKRSAVVTGGARGIGLAIARRLLEQGASVTIADLDRARSRGSAANLSEFGNERVAVRCATSVTKMALGCS